MSGDAELTIRPYRPGDETAILESFNLVFREVCGAGYVDRDLAFWRWEYLDNPAGHRIWLAVTADGVVAGHYAGVPYRMATAHGELCFVHAVDSYTHPDHRRGLKRPGLFVQTARPWFDDCAGRGDALVYGYPVRTAWRIGERFLGYTSVRVVDYLCREVGRAGGDAGVGIEVGEVSEPPAAADRLFVRCAADKACLTRRTADYLAWRYARAPGRPYRILAARAGDHLRGLAVLRPVHELVPESCAIVDWLVPEADADTTAALLAAAEDVAAAAGRRWLSAVFPPQSAEHAALQRRGFDVVPSGRYMERRLGHNSFHPAMTTEWLREHWWYTLGDTDLA